MESYLGEKITFDSIQSRSLHILWTQISHFLLPKVIYSPRYAFIKIKILQRQTCIFLMKKWKFKWSYIWHQMSNFYENFPECSTFKYYSLAKFRGYCFENVKNRFWAKLLDFHSEDTWTVNPLTPYRFYFNF